MKKKILIGCILVVFMLIIISYASAIESDIGNIEKKESPLWIIRTKSTIGEKLLEITNIIKTKFLGERIFLIPFQWLKNVDERTTSVTAFCKTFPVSTCSATSVPECCQLVRLATEKGFASCYGGTCYPSWCYTCKCR